MGVPSEKANRLLGDLERIAGELERMSGAPGARDRVDADFGDRLNRAVSRLVRANWAFQPEEREEGPAPGGLMDW